MAKTDKGFPFQIETDSSTPIWVQLRNRIIHLIDTGYFRPGDQLPYIRELAADISINFNTVQKAYLSLQSDGYLTSVRGKGVFVADNARATARDASKDLDAILDECLHACRELGLSYEETAVQLQARAVRLKMMEEGPQRIPGSSLTRVAGGDYAETYADRKNA